MSIQNSLPIEDLLPEAEVHRLTELQHSEDRKGPWKLYVYEKDSEFHRGGNAKRPEHGLGRRNAHEIEHQHQPKPGAFNQRP